VSREIRSGRALWETVLTRHGGSKHFKAFLNDEVLLTSESRRGSQLGVSPEALNAARAALERYEASGPGVRLSKFELATLDLLAVVRPDRPTLTPRREGITGLNNATGKWRRLERDHVIISEKAASVGRLALDGASKDYPIGTGFMIAPRVVVTNRHVIKDIAEQVGSNWVLRQDNDPLVMDFQSGTNEESDQKYGIEEIIFVSSTLDLALLRISASSSSGVDCPPPIALASVASPRRGTPVYALGYPGKELLHTPEELRIQEKIMGGTYGVKKVSPGLIVDYPRGLELGHDCSTLKGSSGSCVISVRTHQVIGLHYHGDKNGNLAIPLWKVAASLPLQTAQ
jgi:hypothetical protein